MKHTKRIQRILLAVAVMVGLFLLAAFQVSAASGSIWVGGVEMASGDYLAVGASATHTTQPSGGYAYFENGVLTLHNYEYEGVGYKYDTSYIGDIYAVVYSAADLKIVLEGENTLTQTNDYSECIYVGGADLTLEENGDGILNLTASNGCGISAYNGDVAISGGTVTIDSDNSVGINAYNGDVTINGGTVTFDVGLKGICTSSSGSVTINDGTVTIDAVVNGIDAYYGCVTINGGTVTIDAGINDIYAFNGDVTVNGGTVTIDADQYGIYASTVTINNGTVTIDVEQYGISASNGAVAINDGHVAVRSRYAQAIQCGNFTVVEGMTVKASTEPDGIPGEYVAENHDTYGLIVIGEDTLKGDITGDGVVDLADLSLMLWQFNSTEASACDLVKNGVVDVADLTAMLSAIRVANPHLLP